MFEYPDQHKNKLIAFIRTSLGGAAVGLAAMDAKARNEQPGIKLVNRWSRTVNRTCFAIVCIYLLTIFGASLMFGEGQQSIFDHMTAAEKSEIQKRIESSKASKLGEGVHK